MEKEMFEMLIGKDEIETRIGELAAKIDYDYNGEEVVVVPVLKGGMIFACSLMLELKSTPVVVDYIDVSSYGNNTSSMGEVIPNKWLRDSVCDKNVLIVDDIIDSGKNIEAFIKKSNKNYNLLGIAIGTKITNAVNRNKIKRLIRENYRLNEQKILNGYSIVFLWKKKSDIENATFNNIKKDMLKIFDKAGIIEETE